MAVASSGDLARAVEGTISTLTKLFDDIGIPESEKRKREVNIYTILNECLSQQLKCANSYEPHHPSTLFTVRRANIFDYSEKEELIEECRKIIKSIKTIERSIHDNDISDENDLRITPPLIECLRELKEKERRAIKSHAERFEAVKGKPLLHLRELRNRKSTDNRHRPCQRITPIRRCS